MATEDYKGFGGNNGSRSEADTLAEQRELFVKKFSTDVLRYFQDTNIMKELITNRTIESGKSESFPIVGNADAEEIENNAAELDVDTLRSTEREIVIGKMTIAKSWITDLDSAMSHYDAKSAQSESIGRALAKKVDFKVLETVISAGSVVDGPSATAAGLNDFAPDDIYTAEIDGALNTGIGVYSAAVLAVTEKTEKDTVGDDVFVFRPAQYFMLLNNPANTGLTWVNDEYAQSGKVPMLLGRRVLHSPHFPALAGAAIATGEVGGVLFSKEAAGCLELMSINTRVDYIPQRVSNLIVGKMAVGYGILNHGCAINIKQA